MKENKNEIIRELSNKIIKLDGKDHLIKVLNGKYVDEICELERQNEELKTNMRILKGELEDIRNDRDIAEREYDKLKERYDNLWEKFEAIKHITNIK